jgi:hypothetical protein
MIELTDEMLFKDLTFIERNGNKYDLHNDYKCVIFDYNKENETLNIVFEARVSKSENLRVGLTFKEVTIAKFEMFFTRTEDTSTLNSFYRGRFEKDGKFFEYSATGARYFYIEFEQGDKIEFYSSRALLGEI